MGKLQIAFPIYRYLVLLKYLGILVQISLILLSLLLSNVHLFGSVDIVSFQKWPQYAKKRNSIITGWIFCYTKTPRQLLLFTALFLPQNFGIVKMLSILQESTAAPKCFSVQSKSPLSSADPSSRDPACLGHSTPHTTIGLGFWCCLLPLKLTLS